MTSLKRTSHEVLSIPRAHQMVMQYSVIDDSKPSSSYTSLSNPCHRVCSELPLAVRNLAISAYHGFLVDPDLLQRWLAASTVPAIQKTIFVVDRKDLDQRTTSSFLSTLPNDVIGIDRNGQPPMTGQAFGRK